MSNYTSTYTEGTGDTIDTADFSTEFDAIETSSATKADKSAPAAANNIAMLDVNGNLADSTITTDGSGNITSGVLTAGTALTPVGAAAEFTSIPSSVKKITLILQDLSTAGGAVSFQIGDSGGYETSGYTGYTADISGGVSPTVNVFSSEVRLANSSAATHSGVITLANLTGNTWSFSGSTVDNAGAAISTVAGYKTLTATLDRLKMLSSNGSNFDGGSVNILYE